MDFNANRSLKSELFEATYTKFYCIITAPGTVWEELSCHLVDKTVLVLHNHMETETLTKGLPYCTSSQKIVVHILTMVTLYPGSNSFTYDLSKYL